MYLFYFILTKYNKKGLETIYNKGVGAYHTNPESVRPQVHSPEQWAMARVYASINPSSKASHVDKKHLIGGAINFHKIHWGAFTKQFNNRKNKRLKNFKEFSNYILKHPNEFNKITKKRANFYKNFIFGRGIIGCGPKLKKEEKEKMKKILGNLDEEAKQIDEFMSNLQTQYEGMEANPTNLISNVENKDDDKEEVYYGSLDDLSVEKEDPKEIIDNIIDDLIDRGEEDYADRFEEFIDDKLLVLSKTSKELTYNR